MSSGDPLSPSCQRPPPVPRSAACHLQTANAGQGSGAPACSDPRLPAAPAPAAHCRACVAVPVAGTVLSILAERANEGSQKLSDGAPCPCFPSLTLRAVLCTFLRPSSRSAHKGSGEATGPLAQGKIFASARPEREVPWAVARGLGALALPPSLWLSVTAGWLTDMKPGTPRHCQAFFQSLRVDRAEGGGRGAGRAY